jgi:hypothetical protein
MVTHAGPSIAVRWTHHATGANRLLQRWLSSRTRHSEACPGALPALVPGERLLSVEADGQGRPVAATDRGIYHHDEGGWRRLGWEQVSRVGWDGPRSALLLWGLTPNVPQRTQVVLRRGSRLVALARERVAWCTLPVPPTRLDGVGTLLAVRRQPGADGLVWLVAFDVGLDGDNQDTSLRLASALHRVRVQAGI